MFLFKFIYNFDKNLIIIKKIKEIYKIFFKKKVVSVKFTIKIYKSKYLLIVLQRQLNSTTITPIQRKANISKTTHYIYSHCSGQQITNKRKTKFTYPHRI